MATSFRYGPGGSYKSACAVWFDLLPALREGRICITNVHGMQPLEEIESRLGEKFPDSTRLVRISSRNEQGFELWQYFFCWAPIGSFILIDECQQVFSTNAGFKMASMKRRPFEDFESLLPKGFRSLFESKWLSINPDDLDEGELDDCQRSRFDESGRINYPANFNDAFMEHRHYNWDIVMLTPDFGQVPKEVKGVAELAKQHKNKDGLIKRFNRKPRILEHDPTRTVTKATKEDIVYNVKVPLDVHLIYSSTITGNTTKSGLGSNIFKKPKFIIACLLIILSFGYIAYDLTNRFSSDSSQDEESKNNSESAQLVQVPLNQTNKDAPKTSSVSGRVPDSSNSNSSHDVFSRTPFKLGGLPEWFPFNYAENVYVSVIEKIRSNGITRLRVTFEVSTKDGVFYVDNRVLYKMGLDYDVHDDCLVELSYENQSHFFTCKPFQSDSLLAVSTNTPKPVELKPLPSVF